MEPISVFGNLFLALQNGANIWAATSPGLIGENAAITSGTFRINQSPWSILEAWTYDYFGSSPTDRVFTKTSVGTTASVNLLPADYVAAALPGNRPMFGIIIDAEAPQQTTLGPCNTTVTGQPLDASTATSRLFTWSAANRDGNRQRAAVANLFAVDFQGKQLVVPYNVTNATGPTVSWTFAPPQNTVITYYPLWRGNTWFDKAVDDFRAFLWGVGAQAYAAYTALRASGVLKDSNEAEAIAFGMANNLNRTLRGYEAFVNTSAVVPVIQGGQFVDGKGVPIQG